MIYVKNPPKHAAEISIQSIFLVKNASTNSKPIRINMDSNILPTMDCFL